MNRTRTHRHTGGILVGLLMIMLNGCGAQPPTSVSLSGHLTVNVPEMVTVGQPLQVVVQAADAVDGTPGLLIMSGSYGPQVYQDSFRSGTMTFDIPGTDTRRSGVVSLIARADAARGSATLMLVAGPPISPLTPLVGPRTIIADGEHWSMMTLVPFDMFGNPVADGTPIELRVKHPDERVSEETLQVQHLLAWDRIWSGTRAGGATITTAAEQAYGPEGTLLEVAGPPVPFTITADPATLPADGRQLTTLRTATLQDTHGNVLPDGTLVTFVVSATDAIQRTIPAYTVDGVAEAPMQAASTPDVFTVWATLYGVESEPLQLAFTPGPASGTFPLIARPDAAQKAIMLVAGPMLAPLRQFIPDGTVVVFRLTDSHGQQQWATASAAGGMATVVIRVATLEPGTYTAEALAGAGSGATTVRVP